MPATGRKRTDRPRQAMGADLVMSLGRRPSVYSAFGYALRMKPVNGPKGCLNHAPECS